MYVCVINVSIVAFEPAIMGVRDSAVRQKQGVH